MRAGTVAALAVVAGAAGWFGPDLLKGRTHQPESAGQASRDLDRDWTRLADKMEAIAHHTRNPQLIVNRRHTDVTGGTGVGAEATVLTIKDGSIRQAGDNVYGFGLIAKVVEQSKDPQSSAVPPYSSFSVNWYGYAPTGLPFKGLMDMNGENKRVDDSPAQPHASSFSFSMKKDIDGWSIDLQSEGTVSGTPPAPYNRKEPIDPRVAASLAGQLSEDMSYLLSVFNLPPGSPAEPTVHT